MKQEKKTRLVAIIRKYMIIAGKPTPEQLAPYVGVCGRTICRRFVDPETFTLGELSRIVRFLRIPQSELEEVLNA